jgi:hypothetical protein
MLVTEHTRLMKLLLARFIHSTFRSQKTTSVHAGGNGQRASSLDRE